LLNRELVSRGKLLSG